MQKERGYIPYKIRTALVPITNFGARLALPLVLVGLLLDIFVNATSASSVGFYLAVAGVVLYGLSTLFTLVTLPVELDASRRAKKMLLEEGILAEDEKKGAGKVLSAAALHVRRGAVDLAHLLFAICGVGIRVVRAAQRLKTRKNFSETATPERRKSTMQVNGENFDVCMPEESRMTDEEIVELYFSRNQTALSATAERYGGFLPCGIRQHFT